MGCDLDKVKNGGVVLYKGKKKFYERLVFTCTVDDLEGGETFILGLRNIQKRMGLSSALAEFQIDWWMLVAAVEALVIVLLLRNCLK